MTDQELAAAIVRARAIAGAGRSLSPLWEFIFDAEHHLGRDAGAAFRRRPTRSRATVEKTFARLGLGPLHAKRG